MEILDEAENVKEIRDPWYLEWKKAPVSSASTHGDSLKTEGGKFMGRSSGKGGLG
jgi:hypothetical protein